MKNTIINGILAAVVSSFMLLAESCESYSSVENEVKEDAVTDRMEIGINGELTKSMELPVADETFTLVCEYDTGKYDAHNWHITDDKSIRITAHTENLPDGYEVYVEHMHADINIKSTHESLNGILQDSMDNESHTYPTDGFYINDKTAYDRVFSIEGYAKDFYEMCGMRFEKYGYTSGSESRLTEKELIKKGVYAQKLHVIFDLNIRQKDSSHFYTTSVESEILIPVSGAWEETMPETTENEPSGTEATGFIPGF